MSRLIFFSRIALLSIFSLVLSGCFDLEYTVEIQSNGSGNLICAFITDPILAEGFKNQKLIEHATEVRNYLKNGRFWHEELVGFSNLFDLSLDNERIAIWDSTYEHTIFPEIKQDRQAGIMTAYLLLKGRWFRYRINFPVGVKKAYPVDIDGLKVEPAYNENSSVWTIPLDLLVSIKNPIIFRIDLEEALAAGDTQNEEENGRGVKIDKISAKSKCGDKASDLRYGIYLKMFEPVIDFDLSVTYQNNENVEKLNKRIDKFITGVAAGFFLLEDAYSKLLPPEKILDLYGIAFQTVGYGAEVFEINDYLPIIFDAFGTALQTIARPTPATIASYVAINTVATVNNLISAIAISKRTDKFNTIAATREVLHAYYEYCGDFDAIQRKLGIQALPSDFKGDRLTAITLQHLRNQDNNIDEDYVYNTVHRVILGVNDVFRKMQIIGGTQTGETEAEDPSQYFGSYSSVSETGDSCEELIVKQEDGKLIALYRGWYCAGGEISPPEYEQLIDVSIKKGVLSAKTASGYEVVWNLKK
ncbi:MAG: hypothetical protein QW838_07195 [Candidatus Nitrosotenuis sp.]